MGARKSWEAGAADKSGSQGRQKKQGVRVARKIWEVSNRHVTMTTSIEQ
jgi:hypothetical protein